MIRRISISNYALIRNLTLAPAPGFNIITGETGAGKSIILGALAILQGKRVDTKSVVVTGEKAEVEAVIVLADGSECVLRREIMSSGRSRAFINGKSVTLAELAETTAPLIDIHSQHQNLQLSEPSFQLEMVDKMAKNEELLGKYRAAYSEYRAALQKYVKTRDEIEQTKADSDYLEYQLGEFDGVELAAGEDDELEKTIEKMSRANEIAGNLENARRLLSQIDNSAVEVLATALRSLRDAAGFSEDYESYADRLDAIISDVETLSDDISDELSDIDDDPRMLEVYEDKLEKINKLKAKHRADTIERLIAARDSISGRLEALRDSKALLHGLEQEARRLKKNALEIASEISERRRESASRLAQELEDRARPLGMDNLVVKINVGTGKLNPDGIDTVEFLFAFNKNQSPATLGGHASGGELSRVMLALKSITVEHQHTPTIIFDEIDTGVSGDVANRMGRLMQIIGEHIQVITITHLPQVASLGDRHFKVYKRDDEKSTQTFITELSADERRSELAVMLSGNASDEAALATADSLLKKTQNI